MDHPTAAVEDPADQIDAVPVVKRLQGVRATHFGASALRPRTTARSASRRSGVRMHQDIPLPVLFSSPASGTGEPFRESYQPLRENSEIRAYNPTPAPLRRNAGVR